MTRSALFIRHLTSALAAIGIAAAAVITAATPAAAAVDCTSITASTDPAVNHAAITGCLTSSTHTAVLAGGTYPVSDTITIPTGGRLLGNSTYPVIALAQARSRLVTFGGNGGEVSFVNLKAQGLLSTSAVPGVVVISGSDNLIHDTVVSAGPTSTNKRHEVGIYFSCTTCTGNRALRVNVSGGFLGIIVRTTTSPVDARIEDSSIRDVGCDGISLFGGSASITGNHIFNNGAKCDNAAAGQNIPGAGIYSNGSPGTIIIGGTAAGDGNTIENNCGHNIDLVNASGLSIIGNTVRGPGNTALDASCTGSSSMLLVDIRNSTISGNIVSNTRATNTVGSVPSYMVTYRFADTGAPIYSDLPAGANTLMALEFRNYYNGNGGDPNVSKIGLATGNTFDNNRFTGTCSSPCVGVGFFTSRSTGFGPGYAWSAATTNKFTNTKVTGSNYGSVRAGGNWFAANSTCTASSSPAPCNDDDSQHNAPNGNWARADPNRGQYSS